MMTLLTAPETLTAPTAAHRFTVEMASTKTELNADGVPVPVATEVLDVLVAEPSLGAIINFLSSKGLLEGYQIMKHWIPQDGCDCF